MLYCKLSQFIVFTVRFYGQWFGENNNSRMNKEYRFHKIYIYT